MTEKEIREAQEMGLMYVEQVPLKFTGRKRMETPERLAPLPEMVPIYEHDISDQTFEALCRSIDSSDVANKTKKK